MLARHLMLARFFDFVTYGCGFGLITYRLLYDDAAWIVVLLLSFTTLGGYWAGIWIEEMDRAERHKNR